MQDRDYFNSTNVETRASLYDYRVAGPSFRQWIFEQLELPAGGSILDVGAGPGGFWTGNADRLDERLSITLLDLSPGMLADARRNAGGTSLAFGLVRANAEQLPFRDGCFDTVTAFHMLHDVDDRESAVAEFQRVLRPGGTVLATTNGEGHLLELREALAEAGVTGSFVARRGNPRFSRGNGAEVLGQSFDTVEIRVFGETLAVPDPAPLLAYALTIERVAKQLDEERAARFKAIIGERIGRDGAMLLHTDSCLVVGRGA